MKWMETIFPLFGIFMNIPQGQLTTLTGEEIDYSKGEEAKVGFLERFDKVQKIVPIFLAFGTSSGLTYMFFSRMVWECWRP